ncbi:Esyt3 [Symbiodinium sp. CCMP2456]|nr:Esyt3 [Symbiodinium sp. CCMP2456]
MHSVSMPGSECYAKPAGLADLKPTFTHCLSVAKDGCNAIAERVGCLSRQSAGSSAQGTPDPCVWCGGKDCHGDSHAGCTAFSMLAKTTANTVTANAFEKVGALEVAHCIASSPEAGDAAVPGTPPVPPVPPPPSPHTAQTGLVTIQNDASNTLLGSAPPTPNGVQNGTKMDCLQPATSCGAIRDKLICLSSKDGRIGLKEHGLNVGGEACVWCGGEPCTSNGGNLCEPYDWLQHGEGLAFAKASSKIRKTAMCSEETRFDMEEVGCLQMQPEGCNNIREKDKCLTSRDGRPFIQVAGFDVHAQPCVWCGGKPCHGNNDNLCEPYDFIINGGGHAFKNIPGPRTVAGCRAGMAYADHLYEDATGKVEEAPALPKEGDSQGQQVAVVGQDQPNSMHPPAAAGAALPLQNIGLDCWYECKQTSGFCEFCGVGNACCREGYADSPKECQGNVHFTTWHHECIVPDHSKSNVAHEQIAIAAQAAAKEAAAGGATAEEQVRQAALAAGQYAKQIDVPPEAAAKIIAAGVEEASKSSSTGQTPSEMKAATIAAQAAVSRGTPQEQLAEVAEATTQVAAEAGKGFQQQAQAAAVAAGAAAGQMGLHAADAAFVAAQGAASASRAAGEGEDSAITAAAAAAHTAAAAAGKSGEALIATITEAVAKVTASAGMSAEDQKAAVTQAADTYAAAAGLSAAAAEVAALHTLASSKGRAPAPAPVPVQIAPEVPSAPLTEVKSPTVMPTGMPENPAPIATPATPAVAPATAEAPTIAPAIAAKNATLPTPEQVALQAAVAASAESPAVMKSAAENAAFNAGSSKEQAAEIARAAAFAVSGGSVSGHTSATIAPLTEGVEKSSQSGGMLKMPDRKAGIDAAEAGAEAARVAAAEGKTPAEQAKAAAEAAGRTAMNGGMKLVGAEEAARSAAVKAVRAAGLDSEEAASVGTSAAEEAASSGAFTAHDIVVRSTPKQPMAIKAKEASEEDAEVAAVPLDAKGCSGDQCDHGRSHLVLPLAAAAVIVLLVCCASYVLTSKKRPRKGERSVAVERPAPADVERAEEAPLIQHPAAQLPAPPTALPRAAVPGAATQAAPLMPRTAVAAPTVYTTAQGSPVSTSYVSYVRGGMAAPTGVRFGVSPAPAAAAAAAHTVSHGAQAGIAGPAAQAATASTMALFDALDANGDGVLDAAELAQLKMGGPPPARPALPSEPVASVTRFPPVFRAP